MTYPGDISREQFNNIAPILEGARKKTRPREVDLYDIFNGLLYIITEGCRWRSLPKEYPKWRTVYSYFAIWREVPAGQGESILDQVLKKIGKQRTYQKWQKLMHDHGYC